MIEQPEQTVLRTELITRFGERTFLRALEMSGIRNCLQALACDGLSKEERAEAYMRAGMHLARLQTMFITTADSAALTECARRIDSAIDMWSLDEIEARDGLPPSEIIRPDTIA